ncbi:MAG: T9SS type A sorting domain-containing protein [Candidatus Onthomorpha sp.]|nr:T9SS type A sorting domain-containing protein [Candidatus Onthomorpha sp.]
MKKLLWVMAALFVSFAVAAQTIDNEGRIIINSTEEFLKIGNNAGYPIDTNTSYIQTADIDLGNMDTLDAAIIKLFRGTYDGGGHSISYSATFRGRSHRSENGGYRCEQHGNGSGNYYGDYGLFGFLHGGVIKNLNLSGEILIIPTPGDKCDNMNYALLCGHAFCSSTIDHCNVSGTVNSQVEGEKGGGDAGLLIGQADGATIQYCTGSGNVSSIGWVGGLIGSGGHNSDITIKACTFSGSVQASRAKSNTDSELRKGYGGFAGGIIGFAGRHGDNLQSVEPSVNIDLCYVNAVITATNVASGIASVAMGAGTATVKNSCAEGSITKTAQYGETDTTTNSTTHTVQSNTHDSNNKTVDELERIVAALNAGRAQNEKAEFDVVNGQIVLYLDGKPAEPCAAVTGLTISHVAPGSLTCSWTAGGSETKWIVSISGGELAADITKNVTTNQDVTITDDSLATVTITDDSLTTSQSNYVLSVVADCEGDGPNSIPTTSSFVISCPTITGMNVTPAYTSATVTWTNTGKVKAELYQGEIQKEEAIITSAQSHPFNFPLTPNTTYKVKLSAACGNSYGEATERVFTTKSLPIVSGLTTAPSYNGSTSVGSVTISWDAYTPTLGESDYYEMVIKTLLDGTTQTFTTAGTSYTKTPIDTGSYTVKVRAKYGDNYSDWTDEYPFVISDPDAPKNPTWTLTLNEANTHYNVTVTWTKGNQVDIYPLENDGNLAYSKQYWKVNNSTTDSVVATNASTNEYSYTFTSVEQGSDLGVSIVEYLATKAEEQDPAVSSSSPLYFTIPIPCFEIEGTPTVEGITITQTSATLSGLSSGYVVVLSDGTDTTNYTASGVTLLLTDLTPATHYTAEVRRYCNQEQEKYSSKTVEFTTVGCYSPTNVKVTDITPLQAKVSWTKGNPNLNELLFYYILEEKINGTYTQVGDTVKGYSGISKTFTNLKPATEYRVSVAEQCGTDYGIPTKIPFTTSSPGNFVAINTGSWGNAATWQDGRIPNGIGTITINSGVTVTLDRPLVLTNNYTLTNNGTLLINNGELVNTTDNNNLGNVRISFTATQNKWKFIGAPFTSSQDSKYRLESIEPVSGSDVAVVLYDYQRGEWSNSWATINDRVPQAEGFFAWPFYNGTITFNNDYNTDKTVDYSLNNSTITVTRDVITSTSSNPNGNWMSLANPYPAELDIARFLSDNSAAGLQGGVTYNFNGSTFDVTDGTSGSLPVCEGFFVNFSNSGNDSVTFNKTQMKYYPSVGNTKSKTVQNPWIEMSLVNKRDKVKFFFVRNPLAEQGYDKYDANKLFATTGVAEPYFVTDGMNLVKEEVKELPYYATLNVRSEQDTLMTFVADKIPEGYRVSLIDGEQTIEMNEGSRYETNISAGENADRFKLLIQNNVGLNQVSQADITITNSNRHVAISAEAISNVEVFNALGQRVYQTKASTFTLSGVQSGVYVVRVSTAKGTKSQKIVVE